MNYGKLLDQAYTLHTALNNAAYAEACRYIKFSSYQPASENNDRLERLNRMLGRVEKRIARRITKKRQAYSF